MIMNYHLVFMILSVLLLLMTMIFIWFQEEKERLYPALILIGLNMILSQIVFMGFFGIDIIGYASDGTINLNTVADMFPYFTFFWVIFFLNIVFIIYVWYKHTRQVLDIREEEHRVDYGI